MDLAPDRMLDLPCLDADALAQRLKKHIEGCGGLIAVGDLEIARECVRRARHAEQAEQELAERLRRYTG